MYMLCINILHLCISRITFVYFCVYVINILNLCIRHICVYVVHKQQSRLTKRFLVNDAKKKMPSCLFSYCRSLKPHHRSFNWNWSTKVWHWPEDDAKLHTRMGLQFRSSAFLEKLNYHSVIIILMSTLTQSDDMRSFQSSPSNRAC